MSILKKIYKIVSNCIFYSLLFVLCVITINISYNKIIKKETLPRILDYYVFNVKTGSMEPTIHVGEYIIVKKTNDVKVDDIVTFSKDDYFITHRIKEMNKDEIITKGDANNLEDEPITKDDIVGRFVCKSKLISYIIEYKYHIIGFVIGIYLFSFLFKGKNRKELINEKEE
jgi:signal peptidase